MKLVTFTHNRATRIGAVEGDEVVDFSANGHGLPPDMLTFLEQGDAALAAARTACASGQGRLALADVALESPILRPPKILAVGLNYRDHVEETGMPMPQVPMIFNKQSTSAMGPYSDIHLPAESEQLDYEGELGIVIGKRCRRVSKANAAEVIAGYTVVNDVSVRDWQMASATFTMGKSWDTHCPIGPYIVTGDEVPDPHALDLHTWVNGELRQSSNTKYLIFNCFDIVEHLSTAFTLEPGDVIPTGTPSGVAMGLDPVVWLKAGDVVRITIDRVGTIENPVVNEPR
ncbi:fumarylacetoacetate hydrolase family protein [Candidatus Entotheonella palauensis]|uniref:5-carboxymethyl-2-hydroxymuconate isomerase n=1 Tax=Candidatus Entotheonella gemina TaxID=1429439 RepID=W4M9L1_9BACT|nr:fumarylacetoacetate hydrolase family protein [Candidatus Entotheonella palauensis]ETX06616.1 MAG: 5-carboxymethyl-2-hydroxymuconate isomerase [Candidatus Entotheonella gemina]